MEVGPTGPGVYTGDRPELSVGLGGGGVRWQTVNGRWPAKLGRNVTGTVGLSPFLESVTSVSGARIPPRTMRPREVG